MKAYVSLTVLLCLFTIFTAHAEPPIEVIYWQSADVPNPSPKYLESINDTMTEVQAFYASEMDKHGYGEKTFAFKQVQVLKGKKKLHEYNSSSQFIDESPLIERGLDNQIYVIFLGNSDNPLGSLASSRGICHTAPQNFKYCNNRVMIPGTLPELWQPLVAHEIAHAYDITWHAPNRLIGTKVDVMFYPLHVVPGVTMTLKDFVFNAKDAKHLNDASDINGNKRLSVQKPQEITFDTDIDNDGYTTLFDCMIVRSGITSQTTYDTDVNDDGKTNILDLIIVQNAASKAIAASAPRSPRKKLTTWADLKRK